MQTRLANRQDEKEIKALTEAFYKKDSMELDIEGKDKDLRNIEGNYLGKNGIFLVTEEDGKVLAYLAAREKQENLLVERFLVSSDLPEHKADELAVKLMDITLNHAYQADFAGVEVAESIFKWIKKDHAAFRQRGLS